MSERAYARAFVIRGVSGTVMPAIMWVERAGVVCAIVGICGITLRSSIVSLGWLRRIEHKSQTSILYSRIMRRFNVPAWRSVPAADLSRP